MESRNVDNTDIILGISEKQIMDLLIMLYNDQTGKEHTYCVIDADTKTDCERQENVMPTVRLWIYTDDEHKEAVLISSLSQKEQEELSIALNVQAMKQIGYERTDNIQQKVC